MPRNYGNESPTVLQRLPEFKGDNHGIRAFLREAKVAHIAQRGMIGPF